MDLFVEALIGALLVLLGFSLREYSTRRESETQKQRRWDKDKRQLYSEYLAAADEHDEVLRTLKRIDEELDDPESALIEILGEDAESQRGTAPFAARVGRYEEILSNEREKAYGRRTRTRQQVRVLQSQMEILSDRYTRVLQIGLDIYAGEDGYRERRREFLNRVKEDLEIPEWPLGRRRRGLVRRLWLRAKKRFSRRTGT